jgi:excisionase family DNA binding protein
MDTDSTTTRLLTLRDAASRFDVGLRRLRNAVRAGELRAIRPGVRRARARVYAADVARWLECLRDPDPHRPGVVAERERLRHALGRIRARAEEAIEGPPVDSGWLLDLTNHALRGDESGR